MLDVLARVFTRLSSKDSFAPQKVLLPIYLKAEDAKYILNETLCQNEN